MYLGMNIGTSGVKAVLVNDRTLAPGFDPQPRSGRREYLESLVNRYV